MATKKRWPTIQPPHPGSRFDLEQVTEEFRQMRIAREAAARGTEDQEGGPEETSPPTDARA